MNTIVALFFGIFASLFICSQGRAAIDCSEAYEGVPTRCERIKCDEKSASFLGTWTGPMEQPLEMKPNPEYRKYQNTVTYDAADCLKNLGNGDTFIIGRQTDVFPASHGLDAKIEKALLITGRNIKNQPFLRTVELVQDRENKTRVYELVHKNDVAVLSIWKETGIQDGHPYTVETIDAQDWTVPNPKQVHRRNVTVTLESGGFNLILVRGYHVKQ